MIAVVGMSGRNGGANTESNVSGSGAKKRVSLLVGENFSLLKNRPLSVNTNLKRVSLSLATFYQLRHQPQRPRNVHNARLLNPEALDMARHASWWHD